MPLSAVPPDVVPLVEVAAGSFEMGDSFAESGSTDRGELPVRPVDLRAYRIGETEVTWEQWVAVRDLAVQNGYDDLAGVGAGKADGHPVHSVNWFAAVKWCNAASEIRGLEPVYRVSEGGPIYRTGQVEPFIDYSKNGYRLPTEAEWEKAARGGLVERRFPWGDEIDHSFANYYANGSAQTYDISPYTSVTYHPDYYSNQQPHTSPVKAFPANGLGLYDVAGNLSEWCNDWWSQTSYATDSSTNPVGPSTGTVRVRRGGSWENGAKTARVANRSAGAPAKGDQGVGFRVVRTEARMVAPGSILHGAVTGFGEYLDGATATLEAIPDAGYTFAGWTGDASGLVTPLSVEVTADRTIGALFIPSANYSAVLGSGFNIGYSQGLSHGINVGTAAVQADPAAYNLFDAAMISSGLRLGGLRIADANGTKEVSFDIEISEDLQTWSAAERIQRTFTIPASGSLFIRVAIPE